MLGPTVPGVLDRLARSAARVTAAWLVALGLAPLVAEPTRGQSYPVRVYTETSGLPSSGVADVVEAPDGRIWIATRNGISTYDGVEWRTFGGEEGLPRSNFKNVRVDSAGGALALSTRNRSVYRFDGRTWSALPQPEHESWLAATFTAFEMLTVDGETLPVLGTQDGLWLAPGDRWRRLPGELVFDLATRRREVLAATDRGLLRLAAPSAQLELVADGDVLPSTRVAGVAVEHDDLWLAGDRWLGRLTADGFELLVDDLPPLEATAQVRLEPDGRGGVFFTDHSVVFHVDASGRRDRFDVTNGFAAHGATALYRSSADMLWLASDRGLSKLVSLRFASYRQAHGLLADEVSAIVAAAPGVLILGHNFGFTQLVDGRPAATLELPISGEVAASRQRVMDMVRAPDGTVWAAVNPLGLWRLPRGKLEAARLTSDLEETLGEALNSLAVDAQGRLWLAGSGLAYYDGRGVLHRAEPRWLRADEQLFIRRLHAGSDGRLFAATRDHGLLIGQEGEWRSAKPPGDDPPPSLFTVTSTDSGRVWVGAGEGLFTLRAGRLERSARPEVTRPVYSLLEHPSGVLWIGTDFGFVRWDGSEARRYGIREGLAGHEANRAALAVDDAGDLWLGTDLGVSHYEQRYDRPARPPRTILEGVEVAGRLEELDQPLELPWHENNLVFRFRALSFVDESAVQYSGQLIGADESFSAPQTAVARRLHYLNLPPGTYRFQVRARIGEGAWNPAVVSSEIHIGRPFWTTAWFFTAIAATLLFALTGVFYAGTLRLRARAAERELEKARELEAKSQELLHAQSQLVHSEKMAALGQLVAGVAHEVNNPVNFILSGVPLMREDFHRLCELVPAERQDAEFDELRQGYDELVDAVTDGAERTADIVDGLRTFSRLDEAALKRIDLNASIDATLRLLHHQTKDRIKVERHYGDLPRVSCYAGELNQVFMNLLMNAVQAIDGRGTVTVTTSVVDGGRVRVSVRDTGCGLDAALRDRIFEPFFTTKPVGQGTGLGLSISHGIVERHGGTIEVESEPGAGTAFTVTLPLEAPRQSPPEDDPQDG